MVLIGNCQPFINNVPGSNLVVCQDCFEGRSLLKTVKNGFCRVELSLISQSEGDFNIQCLIKIRFFVENRFRMLDSSAMARMLLQRSETTLTQVRVRLEIPSHYQQSPLISELILTYGLVVNITGASLHKSTESCGWFDLELKGTVHQIRQGLDFLESLNVTITGKANSTGDSWYY